MIPMTSEKEETRQRLAMISARHRRIADDRWVREIDADGEKLVTARAVFEGGRMIGFEKPEVLLSFDVEATHDERGAIFTLREDVRFLLDIIDLSRRLLRSQRREERAKDYAAQAAMKCAEPAFQRFLGAESVAVADIRLKARLGIESKRELNVDKADAWRALMREFSDWMRGQG